MHTMSHHRTLTLLFQMPETLPPALQSTHYLPNIQVLGPVSCLREVFPKHFLYQNSLPPPVTGYHQHLEHCPAHSGC